MIYPEKQQTVDAIAEHYNSLDPFYRQLWGEHIHHGYWKSGNESVEKATEQLVELVVETGKIDSHCKVLDVGCGYGATSRLLATRWGAQVTALTVSKNQWEYARSVYPESSNPHYILRDFFNNDFKPQSFDRIISVESSEHMVDKPAFFKEVARLLKPEGCFVTCAWLAKNAPKAIEVKYLLEPICREGRLPNMGSELDYREMMAEAGLSDIQFSDISNSVKKTWSICSYRTVKGLFLDKNIRRYFFDKKSSNREFAKTLFRIWLSYQTKSMRYGLFSATKR